MVVFLTQIWSKFSVQYHKLFLFCVHILFRDASIHVLSYRRRVRQKSSRFLAIIILFGFYARTSCVRGAEAARYGGTKGFRPNKHGH